MLANVWLQMAYDQILNLNLGLFSDMLCCQCKMDVNNISEIMFQNLVIQIGLFEL